MQFLTLALLATTAAASPMDKFFNLKTFGATEPKFNDLYVSTYHVSSTTSDAVLQGAKEAQKFSFGNGTVVMDVESPLKWEMELVTVNEAEWNPVQVNVNAGAGGKGFSVQKTGLEGAKDQEFGGWLACDWYHGVPQLFFLAKEYKAHIPSTCSKVQLKPE
ncbi:hypothetical protein N7474_010747 [Penicillium riverlandense]|uniref:uncharacterized protein n=1 Tax=Penicillium riverlandense TaxID=1903569 RepID=UPI002546E441|nr:uncharacterized protein N7474_010747 [Penicillium riverlandense]KAJ5804860.1 hypothetical protein N7474_010747 [Penicillium riverlandense]